VRMRVVVALLGLWELRPRWWRRADVLAVASLVLVVVLARTSREVRSGGTWGKNVVQQADGSWGGDFIPGYLDVLQMHGSFTYVEGTGWRLWQAGPEHVSLNSGKSLASAGLTAEEIAVWRERALRESALIRLPNEHRLSRRNKLAGYEMLAEGTKRRLEGAAAYYGRRAMWLLAMVGAGVAVLVGSERARRRLACFERIRRAEERVCPACKYPLVPPRFDRCPECGLDVVACVTEARALLNGACVSTAGSRVTGL
jgi:hypothetical protein